jgi:hypothetical protein
MEFEGENGSILKSGLLSRTMEMAGIEGWSMNETPDLRLSPVVVTTETVTPTLLFTKGTEEVLQNGGKSEYSMSLDGPT